MEIGKRAIDEFREIYREEYGRDIDEKKAKELGVSLLKLLWVILKPNNKSSEVKV